MLERTPFVRFVVLTAMLIAARCLAAQDSARVIVTGHLSGSSADIGDTLRFWLTIQNWSDSPIEGVRLDHLDTPGFEIYRRCWVQGAGRECGASGTSPDLAPASDPDRICARLEKGESRTVWGDLMAKRPNDAQNLIAVVSWSAANKARSSSVALLGHAASLTWWVRTWTGLRGFLKDVGVPILLLVMSIFFGVWQRFHEVKQTERAQLTETWSKMLPESHTIAKKYYIPMCGAFEKAIEYATRYRADKTSPDARKHQRMAFYWFSMLTWRTRNAVQKVGGYYFKNRIGEELVAHCWKKYSELYGEDEPTIQARSQLLDLLDGHMTFDAFVSLLHATGSDSKTKWETAWSHFEPWIGGDNCGRALPYLRAFLAILTFEANRPYKLWYGENLPMHLDGDAEATLNSLQVPGIEPEKIRAYIDAAKIGN